MLREQYEELLNAYREDREDVETIRDAADALGEYVRRVNLMETSLRANNYLCDAKERGEEHARLDRERHNAHEAAISAVTLLNGMAQQKGLELFYKGNLKERREVAAFCLEWTDEMFKRRWL